MNIIKELWIFLKPIVCSPKDAFKCYMGNNLDLLVVEKFIMYKSNQNKNIKKTISKTII